MIKNKFVYSVFALLLCLFVVITFVVPKLNIDTKNTTYSYETKVFNEKKVTTVNIEVDEEDWAYLKENAQDEEYIQGTVTIAGKTVNNVAIRAKGNSSLSSVVRSDSDRYSLKIDFDYYDDTQSLYGLKKLNLNNNYSDSTLMKEFVSYEMMEQMGLPTPSHSYMYVTVNGDDYGLFLGVEQIEETFLAKEYNDNSGYLYKPDGTGSDLVWISDDIDDYTGVDLKTNEKDAENSKIIDFLKEINSEDGDLESVMDVDNMLRYFAMNTALVSLDSYQGTMKHNYYLYEQDGKFSIIPWDYNMSFGGFGVGMGGGMGGGRGGNNQQNAPAGQMPNMNNGTSTNKNSDEDANVRGNRGGMDMMGMGGNMMSEDNINFSITTPVSGTTLEQRPLLNALLSNDTYRAQYEAYLEEIATNIFTEKNVQAITNDLAAILTTYVEADPTKFSTTEQFLEGVSGDNSLAAFTKARSESILKQLSGELIVENTTSSGFPPGDQGNTTEGHTNANEQDNKSTNGATSPPTSNGGQGGGFDPSTMPNGGEAPNGQAGGFDPSNMPNGGQPPNGQAGGFDPSNMPNGGQPPNGQAGGFDPSNIPNGGPPNMNGEDFDPANMPNGGPGGMPGMGPNANNDEESHFVWTKNEIILASVSGVLLLLALIFVFKFKRRR